MATLNVKHLPDALYRKLKARAKRERRSVTQEVVVLLEQALDWPAALSILELRGLGRELWREIDAGSHVAGERGEWR
jgi:plasmid stability protein